MSGPSLPAGLSLLHSQITFHPPAPTASFAGQTIIVTGANAGLGRETAKLLVKLGASKVILACRNVTKGEDAKAYIEQETSRKGVADVWQLDVASFNSIHAFAKRAASLDRIDVLVHNAGIWPKQFEVAEGHEMTITVNVISPFLLTRLLLPQLQRTTTQFQTTPRVTIVTSTLHKFAALQSRKSESIFEALARPIGAKDFDGRYHDSKLLVMLYGQKLAASIPSSSTPQFDVCLDFVCPGWCLSNLKAGGAAEKLLARPTEEGAKIIVDAVDVAKSAGRNGAFLSDCKIKKPAAWIATQEGQQTAMRIWEEMNDILDAECEKA